MNKPMGFWRVFRTVFKKSILNRDTFAIFVLAVAGYLIFYAWPYLNQSITDIPTAVVDLDRSGTSRGLIHSLDATPGAHVVLVTDNPAEGDHALRTDEAAVVLTIPADFEKRLAKGENSPLALVANGAFPVKGRAVHAALAGVVTAPERTIDNAPVLAGGTPGAVLLKTSYANPGSIVDYRFNEIGGYANYTVPMVGPVILQAVLMMAVTLTIGGWLRSRENRPPEFEEALRYPLRRGLAVLLSFWVVGIFWYLYMEGFDFWLFQFSTMTNPLAVLTVGALFVLAIVSFAMMVSFIMGSNQWTSQAVVMMSAPSVFIAGPVWPLNSVDNPVVLLISQLIPSSSGIRAILAVSQDGAPWTRIAEPCLQLLLLSMGYLLIVWALVKLRRRRHLR